MPIESHEKILQATCNSFALFLVRWFGSRAALKVEILHPAQDFHWRPRLGLASAGTQVRDLSSSSSAAQNHLRSASGLREGVRKAKAAALASGGHFDRPKQLQWCSRRQLAQFEPNQKVAGPVVWSFKLQHSVGQLNAGRENLDKPFEFLLPSTLFVVRDNATACADGDWTCSTYTRASTQFAFARQSSHQSSRSGWPTTISALWQSASHKARSERPHRDQSLADCAATGQRQPVEWRAQPERQNEADGKTFEPTHTASGRLSGSMRRAD